MIYLGYGNPNKGPGFSIDEQGRMLTTIYKSQLRNKSWINWLWWKIDAYLGDGSTAIYYLTAPDQTAVQLLGEFKSFQVPKLGGPKLLPLDEAGLNPGFKDFRDKLEITVGKDQKGYVERVKIRSPLDYRAGFELKNGAWKIIYFIAGD